LHCNVVEQRAVALTARQPARQGERNEEVLRELGYSDDHICDFTNRGVLVHTRDTN
jgi:crotonobetainyl-CoA:carnitine CoA-transferase CaiB-like acyl-CoA transferase